jgi:hypothetical protein
MLILEQESGGALMGPLTPFAKNPFNIKVLGSVTGDPGLTFSKSLQ